jgi:protein required for attachment to host cells
MNLPANSHVAVIDGERFVLMRNCGTAAAPELESEGEPAVDDTNRSAGVRHQDNAHSAGMAAARSAILWIESAPIRRRTGECG